MNKGNDDNKLDAHVRNTLGVFSDAEPNWSAEDTAFWDKMQPKIDLVFQKKRKKRGFIIFFFGILACLSFMSVFFGTSFNDSKEIKIGTTDIAINNEITTKNIEEKRNIDAEIQIGTQIAEESQIEDVGLQIDEKKIIPTKPNSNFKNESLAIEQKVVSSNVNSEIEQSNSIDRKLARSFQSLSSEASTNNLNNTHKSLENTELAIGAISLLGKIDQVHNNVKTSRISSLFLKLENKQSEIAFNKSITQPIITDNKMNSLWEIGISHSRFIRNPFVLIPINQLNENKSISLVDKRFRSYNFFVNRKLKNNLSLTFGWHYFKQYAQLEYLLTNIPYQEDEENLQTEFGEIAGSNIASLEDNFQKDKFFITFLPGKTIEEGDLLDITGSSDVNIKTYQLPLQINYTRKLGNIEFVGFTGLSLNAVFITIPRFEVEIKYNEVLISNDINFSPQETSIFFPNIILGGGIRYAIGSKWCAQVFYNYNPLDSKFARLQYGLSYKL